MNVTISDERTQGTAGNCITVNHSEITETYGKCKLLSKGYIFSITIRICNGITALKRAGELRKRPTREWNQNGMKA